MRFVVARSPKRIALAGAALLAAAAVGALLALSQVGTSESSGTGITAHQVAAATPTDQIRHVYVPAAKAAAARAVEKRALRPDRGRPVSGHKPAPPKPGPGGIPPASVGNNGSFDPPSAAERKRLSARTLAGVGDLPPGGSAFLVGRTALAPPSAPDSVDRAIGAANAIVGRPYIWGGGHSSWNSRGYDCSGAVSYALGGGGLLSTPLDSTRLEKWGEPGPGQWITVYANAGHAYAVIAGLRWDTVGDERGTGPRWHAELPYPKGYVARHPAGL